MIRKIRPYLTWYNGTISGVLLAYFLRLRQKTQQDKITKTPLFDEIMRNLEKDQKLCGQMNNNLTFSNNILAYHQLGY